MNTFIRMSWNGKILQSICLCHRKKTIQNAQHKVTVCTFCAMCVCAMYVRRSRIIIIKVLRAHINKRSEKSMRHTMALSHYSRFRCKYYRCGNSAAHWQHLSNRRALKHTQPRTESRVRFEYTVRCRRLRTVVGSDQLNTNDTERRFSGVQPFSSNEIVVGVFAICITSTQSSSTLCNLK